MSQAPRPNRETVVDNALIREILRAEIEVTDKYEALTDAQTDFDVASLKYAALRDILEGRWGQSAYRVNKIGLWPDGTDIIANLGRWRFIHKRLGQAVIEVLQDFDMIMDIGGDIPEDSPERGMELSAISQDLTNGGAQPTNPSQGLSLRAVNAALMNTNRIQKTEDGKYRLAPVLESEDDLPL